MIERLLGNSGGDPGGGISVRVLLQMKPPAYCLPHRGKLLEYKIYIPPKEHQFPETSSIEV